MESAEHKAYQKALTVVLAHYMRQGNYTVKELARLADLLPGTVDNAVFSEAPKATSFIVVMKLCGVLKESLDSVSKHVERIKEEILAKKD